VDQILAWLELKDPGERPRLVTSWFHGTDGVGHRKGPDAPSAASSLRRQDAELGRLLEGLSARGLLKTTTLLVVSDHGMAPVERLVNLSEALDAAGVRASVLGAGGFATLRAGSPADAERAVDVARGLGLEAWLRERAPLPVDNPRFGDAVVVAPVGTAIVRKGLRGKVEALLARVGHGMAGSHGHRPDHPSMSGVFVAFGAGVPRGARLGPVRAIDLAPTLLSLLGVPAPEWMQGRPLLGAAVPSPPRSLENPRP
jgi:arylsulfatase A-like enzyme